MHISAFLRTTHKKACDQYGGEGIIGSLDSMHPLVRRMIEECAPHEHGPDSRYEECMTFLADHMNRYEGGANEQDLRQSITPEKFSKLMIAFALGMQFAAKKVGGEVRADNFEFRHTFTMNGTGFNQHYAAAAYDDKTGESKIVLHPKLIFDAIKNPGGLTGAVGLQQHALSEEEAMLLIGVEEMLHLYQSQQGQKSTYRLDELDLKAYETDPSEVEADTLQQVAVRELGLGAVNRGQRRR